MHSGHLIWPVITKHHRHFLMVAAIFWRLVCPFEIIFFFFVLVVLTFTNLSYKMNWYPRNKVTYTGIPNMYLIIKKKMNYLMGASNLGHYSDMRTNDQSFDVYSACTHSTISFVHVFSYTYLNEYNIFFFIVSISGRHRQWWLIITKSCAWS